MVDETADLLLEVGTEELPASCQPGLARDMAAALTASLRQAGVEAQETRHYATPRRLAVLLHSLPVVRQGSETMRYGPPVKPGADNDPAVAGFARSCGCTPDQLETGHDGKTDRWLYRARAVDVPLRDLLPGIVEKAVADTPCPRGMYWGDGRHYFIRPVRWLLVLFGDEVVPAELFGHRSGRRTYGRRVVDRGVEVKRTEGGNATIAPGAAIDLDKPADYCPRLLENGIRADFDERRAGIRDMIGKREKECAGQALIDEGLLDEVTAMVEWPVALIGRFDEKFLSLPRELLALVMRGQQRFFPVCDAGSGALKPVFIGISNTDSADPAMIARGYQKVLVPRLEDAAFFWQRDRGRQLADKEAALAELVFHHRLGSMRDRSERIALLAAEIAKAYGLDGALSQRAGRLCKCDLLTEIVGEFPELQGVAGGYYAAYDGEGDGEGKEVAAAISQHYRPVQADGELPDNPYACVLAVADKIDLVCSIFSVDEGPSAEADPFAVRRAAIGCLRILAAMDGEDGASGQVIDLSRLIELALAQLNCRSKETEAAIVCFFHDRWRAWHLQRGTEGRLFDAVASHGLGNVPDFQRRLQAVSAFLRLPQAAALAEIHKRVRNILRQAGGISDETVDRDALVLPEEKALAERCEQVRGQFSQLDKKKDYQAMLLLLAEAQPVVQDFFDKVKVMDEDPERRRNRLALLADLSRALNHVADLSRLSDG